MISLCVRLLTIDFFLLSLSKTIYALLLLLLTLAYAYAVALSHDTFIFKPFALQCKIFIINAVYASTKLQLP